MFHSNIFDTDPTHYGSICCSGLVKCNPICTTVSLRFTEVRCKVFLQCWMVTNRWGHRLSACSLANHW